ncbi:hypothetical protein J6590_100789 [Homalodisca vitripennis]|nr:hypothetical protein J6590_100789 [Homalodisca vitripennis]
MWSKRIKNAHRLLSCDVTSRHYPTTNGPSWPASQSTQSPPPDTVIEYSVDPHTLQWRRGKQLQQWNVAYSGDEENNCNSGTSLTVATRKTTATVNYSDLVRKGNKRNEHVQITANVQGHSGLSNGRE